MWAGYTRPGQLAGGAVAWTRLESVGSAQGGPARVRRAGRGREREGLRPLTSGRSGAVGAAWASLTRLQPPPSAATGPVAVPGRSVRADPLLLSSNFNPFHQRPLTTLPCVPPSHASSPHLAPLRPATHSLPNPNTGCSPGKPRGSFRLFLSLHAHSSLDLSSRGAKCDFE